MGQDGLEIEVYKILFDFGVIGGPAYISFLNSRSLRFHFSLGFVSSSFYYRYLNRKFDAWDFQNRGFRKECIAKIDFSRKSFLMNSRVHFNRFLEALGAAFLVFSAPKTDLKIADFFGDVTNSQPVIWRGRSHGIWALKTINTDS